MLQLIVMSYFIFNLWALSILIHDRQYKEQDNLEKFLFILLVLFCHFIIFIVKTIKDAGGTIKDTAITAKNNFNTSINRIKIADKITSKLPGEGIMGGSKLDKAARIASKMVNKGNYSGARDYVKSQNKKMGY